MKYDVCIVGAGPAGLSAAFELSRSGAKCIVLDKQVAMGKKACGGGLTLPAKNILEEMLQTANVPLMTNPCNRLIVHSTFKYIDHIPPAPSSRGSQRRFPPLQGEGVAKAEKNVTPAKAGVQRTPDSQCFLDSRLRGNDCFVPFATTSGGKGIFNHTAGFKNFLSTTDLQTDAPYMHTSSRPQWQHALLDVLRDKGVAVRLGERCIGVDNDTVMIAESSPIRADYIIGADGPKSRIRRTLKLPSAVGAICRQLVMPQSAAPHLARTAPSVWFNYTLFGASYGWVFPFENELRIGCGVPAENGAATRLKQSFYQWLAQLDVTPSAGRLESGSIGCRYAGHRFGRIFLAGDAAGMASSVTGEGIWQALVSGKEIAQEITESTYRSAIIPELAARHERTFCTLAFPPLGQLLYGSASLLLKVPAVARAALTRFS
jgi:flavin-dependent dehydrogenase